MHPPIYLAVHELPYIHIDIMRAFLTPEKAHEWLENACPFLDWIADEDFYVVHGTDPNHLEDEERWYIVERDVEDDDRP